MSKKTLIIIISSIVAIVSAIVAILVIANNNVKYTVSFNSNGGTSIQEQIVKKGGKVTKPTSPTKEGYKFVSWIYQNKTYDFSLEVTSDIELIAKWREEEIPTYTIKFNSDGGTTIENQIVEEGNKVIKPDNPTKDEYEFQGWYLNDEEYDFEKEVTKDIELEAKWEKIPKFTVTFNSNGGTSVNQQVVIKGTKIKEPSNPTKKYYKFIEWQLNGKTYNFNNEVNSDITLNAVWQENLPTNLPVPKVEVEGDLFNRNVVGNGCEYQVKLTNYKDYLYQKEDGSYAYFIDAFEITREDGVGLMIQDNIEEPLTMRVTCGESINVYFEVIRKAEDYVNGGKVEAKATSEVITIDTKKDLTPTLKLGSWWCGSSGFCNVQFNNGMYTYRLDVFESVGTEFYDGVIEIYEKENGSYKYIGEAGHESGLYVEIEPNTKKIYVARACLTNSSSQKIYGNYSNELIIDTSKEQ